MRVYNSHAIFEVGVEEEKFLSLLTTFHSVLGTFFIYNFSSKGRHLKR